MEPAVSCRHSLPGLRAGSDELGQSQGSIQGVEPPSDSAARSSLALGATVPAGGDRPRTSMCSCACAPDYDGVATADVTGWARADGCTSSSTRKNKDAGRGS